MYTYQKEGPHYRILKDGKPTALFVSERDAAQNCERMNNPILLVIHVPVSIQNRIDRERATEAEHLRHLIDGGS